MTPRWLHPDVPDTARALLGWQVAANGVRVRLTEVEAYSGLGDDPASHAHRGRTARNAPMFGPPGYAYVYFVFGMHWCLNITCGDAENPGAVLLRAGEVVDGAGEARARRGAAARFRDLARGPARLASALGVDSRASGSSMLDGSGPLLLSPPPAAVDPAEIACGPRVGVAAAHDVPWRFWLRRDPTVSPYRRHVPRRRAEQKPVRAMLEDQRRDGHSE